jgi:preprotein translocase subunit SecB
MTNGIPLHQAGRAGLNLLHFCIERLEYQEADESPEELEEPTLWLSRPVVHEAEIGGETTYMVTLRIRIAQGTIRTFDLTIYGVFRLQSDDDGNEGSPTMLLRNGSVMLLGAARGIIESVTGLSRFGRLRVPSANLADVFNQGPPDEPASGSAEQTR